MTHPGTKSAAAGEESTGGALGSVFRDALVFAAEWHAGDTRKGTGVPYVTHVVEVAERLAYHYPDNADLIVAGVLHDVVEDTAVTIEEIRERFGARVAELVASVTKPDDVPADLQDDPLAGWRYKRQALLAHLDTRDDDVLRLKSADALSNQRAILRDIGNPDVGKDVWERFKAPKDETLWYYREVMMRVERLDEPLVRALRRAHDALMAIA